MSKRKSKIKKREVELSGREEKLKKNLIVKREEIMAVREKKKKKEEAD